MRIAIDLMGSDTSPSLLFEAVVKSAARLGLSHKLVVLATLTVIEELQAQSAFPLAQTYPSIEFRPVVDVITMGDEPLTAVRRKKNSSLITGIRLLKKKQIDGLVTAGNTGALITASTLYLPQLPGINRPALLALLPTDKGVMAVVDVGGNVYYKANHLVQFAKMGAAYQRSQGRELPRVGLLNIGVESKKGSQELRNAYMLLDEEGRKGTYSFHGNIEGREIFEGKVDVLVTDGFTGNVLLKTIEGASSYILNYILDTTEGQLLPQVKELKRHLDYTEYPGAIVCGIDGIVVKCHGNSSPHALFNSIMGAAHLVERNLVGQLKTQISSST